MPQCTSTQLLFVSSILSVNSKSIDFSSALGHIFLSHAKQFLLYGNVMDFYMLKNVLGFAA
jgi:hypothetical protein